MARQLMDLEDELARIWGLVGELTEQLANNRTLVQQLKDRSENVKGQAVHVGTGFPLRRFNLDISDEQFHSELESFASHLVLENQQLQHDNKQLNALLKEYEGTLETVMGKFRGVAHASQQHDLSLHSYYTSLLETLQTAHSSAQLHDNTSLSLLLTRLSTLLRSALRSMGGEDAEVDLAGLLNLELSNGNALILDDSSSPPSPTRSNSSGKKSLVQRAPGRPPPFPGSLPGASGGYSLTNGQADWALEREMEILRLEDENRALRDILAIAEESAAAQAVVEDLKEGDQYANPDEMARRKSSLTVEELEAGAEQEEQAKQATESGSVDKDELEHAQQTAIAEGMSPPQSGGGGLGLGDGAGQEQQRALGQSILGFTTDGPPPEEAIDDGPEG